MIHLGLALLVVAVATGLQLLAEGLLPLGIRPNLLVPALVGLTLWADPAPARGAALCCGWLRAALTGQLLGPVGVAYLVAAFAVGRIRRLVFRDLFTQAALAMVVQALLELGLALPLVIEGRVSVGPLWQQVWPTALYTGAAGLVMLPFVGRVGRALEVRR